MAKPPARRKRPAVPERTAPAEPLLQPRYVRVAIVGTFILLVLACFYVARDFLLPIILALLFVLTLSPVVRFLERRGIPSFASALVIVAGLTCTLVVGGYVLSDPVQGWVRQAPFIISQVEERMRELLAPFQELLEMGELVEEATDGDDPEVQKVAVQQPGYLSQAAANLANVATTFGLAFVLLFFLLASGDMFYEKTVRAIPALSDKKRALRAIYDVEREVSGYLLTVAAINLGLGIAIAFGLFLLDMPGFYIWGALATLLNFIPYLGALLGIAGVGLIALVTFDSAGYALLVPAWYAACTVLEGQFVTPMVLGRRLALNAVAILVMLALWTWLWGVIGALIAVPLLVILKVICDHFDSLAPLGEFLSARAVPLGNGEGGNGEEDA